MPTVMRLANHVRLVWCHKQTRGFPIRVVSRQCPSLPAIFASAAINTSDLVRTLRASLCMNPASALMNGTPCCFPINCQDRLRAPRHKHVKMYAALPFLRVRYVRVIGADLAGTQRCQHVVPDSHTTTGNVHECSMRLHRSQLSLRAIMCTSSAASGKRWTRRTHRGCARRAVHTAPIMPSVCGV